MITNISLTTVYCLDQDVARDFYVDVLGFVPNTDAEISPGYRWVTVNHPNQPELEVTLMTPGPPLDPEAADFVRNWYRRHVALDSGRSSTWTSGAGVAALVAAIATGAGDPWVASTLLDGEYEIFDAAVAVPVRLGPRGVERVLEWELAPEELEALRYASR